MTHRPNRAVKSRINWILGLLTLLLSSSCGGSGTLDGGTVDGGTVDGGTVDGGTVDGAGPVLVFAAASLGESFAALEMAFEEAHPAIDIELNVAGSSALREQILEGAPADVFASANQANMTTLTDAGLAPTPAVFAHNELQIAVPAGNPGQVTTLADFERTDLLIGLCAVEVPCGDFARRAFDQAGVVPAVDTNEPDVRSLTTKVAAGELDAGIVYVTDVMAAGDQIEGIAIDSADNQMADYPISALRDASNLAGAHSFVAFVLSDEGQALLAAYGFIPAAG